MRTKAALRLPYTSINADWKVWQNWREIDRWIAKLVSGSTGNALTTTNQNCKIRFPHQNGPITRSRMLDNVKTLERWSAMWRTGGCCSGGTARVCKYTPDLSAYLDETFKGIQKWADRFVVECCNCGTPGCDTCGRWYFREPDWGPTGSSNGIGEQGSVCHNGRSVYGMLYRYAGTIRWHCVRWFSDGVIQASDTMVVLTGGTTFHSQARLSAYGDDDAAVVWMTNATTMRLAKNDGSGWVNWTSFNPTTYSPTGVTDFYVCFDGTYVWISWEDVLVRVTYSDGTVTDMTGSVNSVTAGLGTSPPRIHALGTGYYMFASDGTKNNAYYLSSMTATPVLLREGATDHFAWHYDTEALTVRDSYPNGYAWWEFAAPYTGEGTEVLTEDPDCYKSNTSINAGLTPFYEPFYDYSTWPPTITYGTDLITRSPIQCWWDLSEYEWSTGGPDWVDDHPGEIPGWPVTWGASNTCYVLGTEPDET